LSTTASAVTALVKVTFTVSGSDLPLWIKFSYSPTALLGYSYGEQRGASARFMTFAEALYVP